MTRRFTRILAAMALLVFTMPSLVAWGQTTTTEDVTLSNGTFSTDHITWTCANNSITIQQLKGTSSNAVNSSYISAPRVYKGHVLSFVGSETCKIKKINITVSGTYYGNSMTAGTVFSNNTVTDNTTDVARTWTSTSGGTHVVSSVSEEGLPAIYIQNVASASNVQLRFTALSITYIVTGTQNTYTVTYHANVTGVTDVEVSYNEGATVTIAENTFSNPGFTFNKWNTLANGSGTNYLPGATIENIQSDIDLYAQWEELDPNTDVLNYAFTGINGTSYAGWTNTSTLGTVYVGQSGGQYSSIQLRTNNNNSGIVTTLSLGNATKVAVNWNSNTQDGRVLNVYGKAAAYSAVTDLYNVTSQGELLGTIVKGTSTELTITGNYAYIGFRSADGAMYLDEIRITWEISNDPVCTVTPDTHEFGNVAIGSTATQSFTVSTANLTGDLTLSMSNTAYTVAPTTIEQNASTTQVTITFAPTSAGEFDASLIVNGSGFINEEVALVSGTGASVRTITFNSGNGTCETQTMSGVDGATINLPTATPSTACDAAGWTFAGWSASNVEETTNAPELVPSEYTINGDATLYAVYNLIEASTTQNTEFNFEAIATANSWEDGHAYTPVNIDPITITANGGGNNGKYYVSDKTWRMYNGGSVTITAADGKSITEVTSNPSTSFTINTDGTASQSFTATFKFKSITVTYSNGPATVTYATSPACLEPVATPTFSPEDGTIFYEDELEVTISCTTEDATIYYTLDGSVPTNESSVYNGTITLTETTTVKAIAMKEGMADSEIAEATYTQLPLSTIAEVRAQGTGSVITKGIVTHMSGVTAYIQDETAAIVVYGSNVPAVGDEIRVSGTLTTYKGLLEIGSNNNPPTITVLSQGHSVEPAVMTIEAINTDAAGNNAYQAKLVRIENATYNNDGTVSQGSNSITVYGTMAGVNDGNIVSFTGNIGCYNSVQIVNPTDIIVSYTLTIPAFNSQNGGYRLISSPIGTVDPENVTHMLTQKDGDNNTYDLYRFDQAEELEWRNYRNDDGGHFNLEVGKGYLYGNLSEVELVFTGTAYSGDGEVTLTKTDDASADFPGWNLVGNPFGVNAYIGNRDFYVMEAGSEIILADRVQEGAEYIKPMEGVFVIAQTNGEKMYFTTTQPTNNGKSVTLNLHNGNNVIDRAMVRFDDGQQLPKFQLNRNSTKLYISQDGKDFAVVCAEEMGAMPVNFKAEDNGTYNLNFSCENVEFSYLHLIDNKTGTDIDLLQTPSYSFEAKTTDYESRFKLVFATGDNSNDDTFAFYSNGSFVINNEGNATLQVIDIMGRIVKSESINGCANVNVNAAPGVYMLRLVNGDNMKVQKVVVR